MRFCITILIVALNCFSSYAQLNPSAAARKAALEGTYKATSNCVECDSTVTKLVLECNPPKCNSGMYSLVKTNYHDAMKQVCLERKGEWYVLPNEDAARDEDVLVIVLDMLGRQEKYPLFLVQSDGSLFELNRHSPERFPEAVIKKGGYLYIEQKGGEAESLNKQMHYRYDYPVFHTFKKVKK
jgi:hypothetical protein